MKRRAGRRNNCRRPPPRLHDSCDHKGHYEDRVEHGERAVRGEHHENLRRVWCVQRSEAAAHPPDPQRAHLPREVAVGVAEGDVNGQGHLRYDRSEPRRIARHEVDLLWPCETRGRQQQRGEGVGRCEQRSHTSTPAHLQLRCGAARFRTASHPRARNQTMRCKGSRPNRRSQCSALSHRQQARPCHTRP